MLLPTVAVFLLTVSGVVRGKGIEPLGTAQLPVGFTVHKVLRTWEEAKQQCEGEDAVLASPITTEVLNAMTSVIAIKKTSYFIGTRCSHFSGEYSSLEGVPLENMTAVVTQMIHQLDPHDGNCLSMDLDSIRVVPCTARLPFMCYKATESSNVATETTTVKTKCSNLSEGYKYYASTGSCYKVHKEDSMTYDTALATCENEGGHLAVIDDDNEAEVIKQINLEDGGVKKFVGLRDTTGHGDWRTVTGKQLQEIYNKWEHGRPKGTKWFDFFCAELMPSGKLDNCSCDIAKAFICEI